MVCKTRWEMTCLQNPVVRELPTLQFAYSMYSYSYVCGNGQTHFPSACKCGFNIRTSTSSGTALYSTTVRCLLLLLLEIIQTFREQAEQKIAAAQSGLGKLILLLLCCCACTCTVLAVSTFRPVVSNTTRIYIYIYGKRRADECLNGLYWACIFWLPTDVPQNVPDLQPATDREIERHAGRHTGADSLGLFPVGDMV